jgi:uncharacterized protein (TIGR02646 family)
MVQIRRTKPSPIIRNRAGLNKMVLETNSLLAAYVADQANYDNGSKIFKFLNSVYGHSKIKRVLLKMQNGKCAFCESNVYSVASGDVEHFRPKGGFNQNVNQKVIEKPGYFWLAYDWENLLFSCESCNRRYKGNLFPIRNCERRAKNHLSNYKREKPFFIDPSKENPKHLIGFHEEVAYGKDRNHRGKKTIEALGLNRNDETYDLKEIRKDIFNRTKATYKLSQMSPIPGVIDQAEIDEAKALMNIFRNKQSQFSSMIQDNFPK